MHSQHSAIPFGTTRFYVAGQAVCRFPLSGFPALRQTKLEFQGKPLPLNFFKHSDEQTIAAMHAAHRLIRDFQLDTVDFENWGAVACPRFFARIPMAAALHRYAAEGAWGISPHLIPHRSLHTVSGTLSQALKIHGPNYGVGGGTDGVGEALLAASALLSGGTVPGVWVLLTGFEPEYLPTYPFSSDSPIPDIDCLAVAMALLPAVPEQTGRFLSIGMDRLHMQNRFSPTIGLEAVAAVLSGGESSAEWKFDCGGWARLETMDAAVETCK